MTPIPHYEIARIELEARRMRAEFIANMLRAGLARLRDRLQNKGRLIGA